MNVHEFIKTIRSGELSNEEIGKGMHKSFKNARELIEDAELLLHKRPARALSLAILALEETAKTVLLTNAAAKACDKNIPWKELEKHLKLRSHAHKQAVYSAYGTAILDKLKSEHEDLFAEESLPGGIGPLLDWMKQLGFYVDVANGQFISPKEFGADNSEWAKWLINVVKQRLDRFEELHGTEEKSIMLAKQAGELVKILLSFKDENTFQEQLQDFIENYSKKT